MFDDTDYPTDPLDMKMQSKDDKYITVFFFVFFFFFFCFCFFFVVFFISLLELCCTYNVHYLDRRKFGDKKGQITLHLILHLIPVTVFVQQFV